MRILVGTNSRNIVADRVVRDSHRNYGRKDGRMTDRQRMFDYLVGVADGLFNVIGSYSTGVSIALTVYAVIAFILMWCMLMSLLAILP